MTGVAFLLAVVLALVGCAGSAVPSTRTAVSRTPDSASVPPSAAATADPIQAVRADLEKLANSMETTHPNLFHTMTETEWRAAVAGLDAMIPELLPDEPERLMVEFMRLVALPSVSGGRDGHTVAFPPLGSELPILGLATYVFADGLYVTASLSSSEDLVGSRITAVAGRPIEDVRALVDPLLPRDNQWTPEMHLPSYLIRPEVLVGLGILETVGPAELTVEMPSGEEQTVEVGLVPPDELESNRVFTTFRLPDRAPATWTSRIGEPFWWEVLHEGATLFVQQNLVETVGQQARDAVVVAAREPKVRRVVLDLRHDVGGDLSDLLPTFKDPAIDRPDRLFVITSTNTFSAAAILAAQLDRETNAVFVGEPKGGVPNNYTLGAWVTLDRLPLPLAVLVATTYEEWAPGDDRLTVPPDISVPLIGPDYFSGRDAALEAILAYDGD